MLSIARRLAALLAAFVLACPNAIADSRLVTMGYVDLSFYEVTAKVVQSVLERLGYNVVLKTGSHAEIYPLLGKGEIDLFVAAWLPNAHAPYWDKYKDEAVLVTKLFEDARLFWAVPDYVPATDLGSVADLNKPAVAARMQKQILGTKPDSGLMTGSQKVMQAYALADSGYELVSGNSAERLANLEENISAKRWFVMPLSQPNYLNRVAKMRALAEPRQLLGGADSAYLAAHKDFQARIDKRIWHVLQRISLSVKAVTEMDYLVNVNKLTPDYAARNWMAAHPDTVNYWVQPDSDE